MSGKEKISYFLCGVFAALVTHVAIAVTKPVTDTYEQNKALQLEVQNLQERNRVLERINAEQAVAYADMADEHIMAQELCQE